MHNAIIQNGYEETQVVIRDTYTEHCPLNKTVSGVSSASSGYSSTRDSTISDHSRCSRISNWSSLSFSTLDSEDSSTATSGKQYHRPRDGSASPLVKGKRKYHTTTDSGLQMPDSELQMPSRNRSTAFTNKTKSKQGMELEKSRFAAKIKALDKIPPKK